MTENFSPEDLFCGASSVYRDWKYQCTFVCRKAQTLDERGMWGGINYGELEGDIDSFIPPPLHK
jgi:hypothetical protein